MSYQTLLDKWNKDGSYAEELTMMCHFVRIGFTLEKIAASYGLTLKELKAMAKADPMVNMALNKEDIMGRREFIHECRKAAYGYYKKEPREEDYVDSKGVQMKRIIYVDKWVPGSFKDREFYGKKFLDSGYSDTVEEYAQKTELKESGKIKCLKKTEKKQ